MVGSDRRSARIPVGELIFALVLIAGGVWLYGQSRGLSFYGDDWGLVFAREGIHPSTLLAPFNGALDLVQVVIYKLLLAVFGLTSYAPFRTVLVLLHLGCVALLFVLARRRLGALGALPIALLVLFLGSAGEILIYPGAMNHVAAMAAGLGMLLALDARTRGGDIAACVLLFVSLAAGGEGIAFAVAALVQVLLGADRRSRWWVPVIPGVFIAVWALHYGRQGANGVALANARLVPRYVLDENGRTLAGLVGLSVETWGAAIGIATALAVAVRIAIVRRVSPQLAGAIAAWLVYWLLTGFARANLGLAVTGRYRYAGAIFALLIVIEAFRDVRVPGWFAIPATAVVVAAAVANAHTLKTTHDTLASGSDMVRADLAAAELARSRLSASYAIPAADFGMTAGQYFSVANRWGSPAFAARRLPALGEALRADVDVVLSTGIVPRPAPPGSLTPACARSTAGRGRPALEITVPPRGVRFVAGRAPITSVQLRRFASGFGPSVGGVRARHAASLVIPPDGSRQPWHVRIVAPGPVAVCPE